MSLSWCVCLLVDCHQTHNEPLPLPVFIHAGGVVLQCRFASLVFLVHFLLPVTDIVTYLSLPVLTAIFQVNLG